MRVISLKISMMAAVIALVMSCRKTLPIADFDPGYTTVAEGFEFRPVNKSVNASSFEWKIEPGNRVFNDKQPLLSFYDTGVYQITLTAIDGSNRNSSTRSIRVKPDTMWRLHGNGSKAWTVTSIVYGGAELLNENCQKDDEFTLFTGSSDTFTFTEGNVKCPDGTYIFTLPASGLWRFNRNKRSLDFSLTALGTPYNFEFVTTKLTRDVFEGKDATNDVVLKLQRK